MGITNMAATIPGFLVPMVVGSLTCDKVNNKCTELFQLKKFYFSSMVVFSTIISNLLQPGIQPWHTAFYITAGLLVLESLIFCIFGSGEEQSWNHDPLENNKIIKLEDYEYKQNGDGKVRYTSNDCGKSF